MILKHITVLVFFSLSVAKALQIEGVRFRKCLGEGLADVTVFGSIAREVTSLRGKTRMRCAKKCAEYGSCDAFVHDNDECILIGDWTLPGSDVDIREIDLSRITGVDGKIKLF